MESTNEVRGLLHRATHRIPGIRAHVEWPVGHQGNPAHGHVPRRGRNHSAARPARFMPAWQRRVEAFFRGLSR
ncbi:hypothetical protein O7635_36725 [Asanoa sp. WMMD1127]|uniref:hypothetical protein n=1 Tax=Asanoa sp. WMMD1127 TaxID=3016107 RepID=UPI002415FD2A|nr:hypothetical protein [Asanoa sp. WMMD1127]MDG4827420.1 hypothetical protein [Asanoa sp. WMMD1127]